MKQATVILLSLLSLSTTLFAQFTKEERKDFSDAEYFYLNEDYRKALTIYLQLEAKDTSNYNVKYRIGMCYLNTPLKIFSSIPYLEKASTRVSKEYREGSAKEKNASVEAYYYLGYAYMTVNEFDKAIQAFTSYKSLLDVSDLFAHDIADREIKACTRARELVKNPREVEINNVGNDINTSADEMNPCVSNNDSTMIFTRKVITNLDREDIEASEYEYLIFQSFKYADEEDWSEPTDITTMLATHGECITLSISGDGKILLLYKDNYEFGGVKDVNQGTLFISNFRFGRWSPIRELPAPINERSDETHASITNDGNTLFFVSDRDGGLGGTDIWVSEKVNNQWQTPKNLGPTINTTLDEGAPFIVNDTILVFSSQGHDNMGGFDIFFSKKTEEGWSTPLNMRPPISSIADDIFYVPTQSGLGGYYAMERHEGYLTFGKNDIYAIDLFETFDGKKVKDTVPELLAVEDSTLSDSSASAMALAGSEVGSNEASPVAVQFAGTLKTGDNNEITKDIILELKSTSGQTVASVNPQPDGSFSMKAMPGDYKLIASGEKYNSEEKNVFIPEGEAFNIQLDITLTPKAVSSGEYLKIHAIFFEFGSFDLSRDSKIEIERLSKLMKENPSMYVEIVGHTDSKGSAEFNKQLSLKRAQSVVDYLVGSGIETSRFVSKGAGEEEHIAINKNPDGTDNPEGMRLNRRVEVKILNSGAYNINLVGIEVPDHLKYKDNNRFSVLLIESKEKLAGDALSKINSAGLPKVEEIEAEGKFVYYFGDYKTKAEAIKDLNMAIEAGYEDAHITDYFELNKLYKFTITKSVSKEPKTYTIQLAASYSKLNTAKQFKGLSDVKEFYGEDGYYRYTYGEFSSFSKANQVKQNFVTKGLNAFVISTDRYTAMKKQEVEKPAYTVQIIAMKEKVDSSFFKDIYKEVTEHIGEDGYYRYTYGTYSTFNAAKLATGVLEKKGFKNLFVRKLEWYNK